MNRDMPDGWVAATLASIAARERAEADRAYKLGTLAAAVIFRSIALKANARNWLATQPIAAGGTA